MKGRKADEGSVGGETLANREAKSEGVSEGDIQKKPVVSYTSKGISGQDCTVTATKPALSGVGCGLSFNTLKTLSPQILPRFSANTPRKLEEKL